MPATDILWKELQAWPGSDMAADLKRIDDV